jgi:hypothetical protein
MTIRSTFTGDFTAIDLNSMADDMLARVVAEHAADRFREPNRANRVIAGEYVTYRVKLDGRTISAGKGEIFPTNALVVAQRAGTRRLPVVIVDWAWESLRGSALQRAVETYLRADATLGRIQSAAQFARWIATGDSGAVFRFLLERYVAYRYPAAYARYKGALQLYRMFRLAKTGMGLLTGGERGEADADVLAWIASELRNGSPVLSGAYRDAHALYGDGRFIMDAAEVTADTVLPEGVTEWSFTNTVPYARKIEFGKTAAGRDFVIQMPPHVYERTAEAAHAQFKSLAQIRYEVRAVIDDRQTAQRSAGTAANRPGVRYPSIVVRFL